jgi:hypothetical protein
LSNPLRHVKKKKIRDLNHRIDQIRLRMRNKKAKRDIPRLQAELNALFKQKDEVMRNDLQGTSMRAAPPRLCPKCNERIGRGYHICKATSN